MLSEMTINQPMTKRLSVLKEPRASDSLLIHEIYSSIQGESSHMGKPCVFIRTTGCHLRCSYCDTEHAFFKGETKKIESIISEVLSYGLPLVELTGGEPLLQPQSFLLLDELVKLNLTVLMETSGAVSIQKVNQKVKVILDIKTPSSLESQSNVYKNLDILWPGCEVKFVISSYEDFIFAKSICQDFDLFAKTHVLFSPVVANIDPKLLVTWILRDKLPVRFQMQLHRVLYGEATGK